MKLWQLWEKKFFVTGERGKEFLFQTDYAFINPDGIITEHRAVNPLGCLETKMIYHDDNFCLWDLRGESVEFLKQYEGWKKSSRKIEQEYLAKGWLI